jgi:putative holliday junction resolvase
LGVDYGTKRIGLAMSDAGGMFVEPWKVMPNAGDVAEALAKLCREEGVGRVVVGLPLNMDGTASWMTREAVGFGRKLASATGLAVGFVDERLSSFEAEQQLKARRQAGGKHTRADRKKMLDALSAAQFLRDHLEGRLPLMEVPE